MRGMLALNPTFRHLARQRVKGFLQKNPQFLDRLNRLAKDELGFLPAPVTTSQPGKFETIFSSAISLGSQAIAAWGKNNTTQISANNGNVAALPTPYGSAGTTTNTNQPRTYTEAELTAMRNNSAGNALGSGLDGIIDWATKNPIYVFGGIAGLYLLFKQPPNSRR